MESTARGLRMREAASAWLARFIAQDSTADVIVAVCAVAALWLLHPYPAAWVLGCAVVVAGSPVLSLAGSRRTPWSGRSVAAWLILLLGAVALGGTRLQSWVLAAAGLTALAVITGETVRPPLRRLSSSLSAHLRLPTGYSSMRGIDRVEHMLLGVCVIAVAAGALWSPALALWAGVVAVVAQCAFCLAVLGNSVRRRRSTEAVFGALEALHPAFYLMWDAPSEGYYQVTLWIPYLQRIGLPFAVITRTGTQLDALADRVDVPIVHCSSSEQIERTVVPGLRTIFYVNTALRNAHYLRFNELRHVQLNHGDSDKPASASKQFRAFDVDFVAGQAAVDRFAHFGVDMPTGQLRIVGRPQVEEIAPAGSTPAQVPTVLYAPTWAGFFGDSDFSSLAIGETIVRALIEAGCRVLFRPHAFTDRSPAHARHAARIRDLLDSASTSGPVRHIWGRQAEEDLSLVDCFNASDAMIADVSSIVTDYLFSEKPLAMVSVRATTEEFRAEFPVAQAAYVVAADGRNARAVVADLLHDDPRRSTRLAMRDYYLGSFPREGYAEVFVRAAREECAEQPAAGSASAGDGEGRSPAPAGRTRHPAEGSVR